MSLSDDIEESRRKREAFLRGWESSSVGYVGACSKCSRERTYLAKNGKIRCEKCGWSPDLGRYVHLEE